MKETEAQAILEDVSQDKRIEAQVMTQFVRDGNGYRVKLVLRRLRVVTIRVPEEWKSIREAWSGM